LLAHPNQSADVIEEVDKEECEEDFQKAEMEAARKSSCRNVEEGWARATMEVGNGVMPRKIPTSVVPKILSESRHSLCGPSE